MFKKFSHGLPPNFLYLSSFSRSVVLKNDNLPGVAGTPPSFETKSRYTPPKFNGKVPSKKWWKQRFFHPFPLGPFWVEQKGHSTQGSGNFSLWDFGSVYLMLMEEILHHLGCIKPCQPWDIYGYLLYNLGSFHLPLKVKKSWEGFSWWHLQLVVFHEMTLAKIFGTHRPWKTRSSPLEIWWSFPV